MIQNFFSNAITHSRPMTATAKLSRSSVSYRKSDKNPSWLPKGNASSDGNCKPPSKNPNPFCNNPGCLKERHPPWRSPPSKEEPNFSPMPPTPPLPPRGTTIYESVPQKKVDKEDCKKPEVFKVKLNFDIFDEMDDVIEENCDLYEELEDYFEPTYKNLEYFSYGKDSYNNATVYLNKFYGANKEC